MEDGMLKLRAKKESCKYRGRYEENADQNTCNF